MTTYDCAMREDLLRSVCQEDTFQTSTGQPYTMTQIKPVKQEKDPNKTPVTPAAPTEVEGPPSSHLRSKTKQQSTTIKQEQPECNPALLDPLECNQPKVEVNQVEMGTGNKSSLVHYPFGSRQDYFRTILNSHPEEESTKSQKYQKKMMYILYIENPLKSIKRW